MRGLFALAWVLGSVLLLTAVLAAGDGHTKDSLTTLKKRLQEQKAILIDVRERAEWDDGHLRDAKLLPLSQLRKGLKKDSLSAIIPDRRIVYLHCASGKRCVTAAGFLKEMGYDARPLKDGYHALVKAGFPKAEK